MRAAYSRNATAMVASVLERCRQASANFRAARGLTTITSMRLAASRANGQIQAVDARGFQHHAGRASPFGQPLDELAVTGGGVGELRGALLHAGSVRAATSRVSWLTSTPTWNCLWTSCSSLLSSARVCVRVP